MFISSSHPEQGSQEEQGGTRLLNSNQHFVVLISLSCSHSDILHTERKTARCVFTGSDDDDGGAFQADVP